MKMFKLISLSAALFAFSAFQTFANPQDESGALGPIHRGREVYVWLTGSRIPQKIILSPVGTPSFNSMSVYDRKQINYVAHPTTEQVLSYDPSARVILGHLSGH